MSENYGYIRVHEGEKPKNGVPVKIGIHKHYTNPQGIVPIIEERGLGTQVIYVGGDKIGEFDLNRRQIIVVGRVTEEVRGRSRYILEQKL